MTSSQSNNSADNHRSPHILIMEDEESIAKGLEMVLVEEGYEVDVANTGAGALEIFSEKKFDLLIADLRLPDKSGLDVIKIVKQQRPETEVVVMTGYSSVSTAVDAMKIGVVDYLSKPFTESDIKVAVGNALKRIKSLALDAKTSDDIPMEKLIQKREVIRVLNRTNEDMVFFGKLLEGSADSLKEYHLSWEAKAAITSGDLKWLEQNVGDLSETQLAFIYKRLEREDW